ncbi:MarC family protein [Microbulbifer litoralis]|uniref:MarC family protein n=1 Tax=Microbulbifer litoralis TaxID=2933965 RepID=UPI0020286BEF|nr:MarC family protein [Microbulbifer sp. GX H0434]
MELNWDQFINSFLLLLVLINPFIMSIYLLDLIKRVELRVFSQLIVRAFLISLVVFLVFAWFGERVFESVFQVRFLAFMIFGGITFLIVGIRLILGIGPPVETMKTQSSEVAGAIAMPFVVGPGTISACVIAGSSVGAPGASLAIVLAMSVSVGSMILLKILHDWVQTRHERYVERYVEIAGRLTALFTGSFAVDMILKGVERWRELL